MRLLEVVRGAETASDALATVMKLSKKIGKLGVVSGVCYVALGVLLLQLKAPDRTLFTPMAWAAMPVVPSPPAI